MSVDALEFLRTEDPVPHGSTAPPVDWVLDRIQSTGAEPGTRRRFAAALAPAVAVAATLVVVAVVVVLAVTHRGQTPAHVPPATRTTPTAPSVPPPESLMPSGGMRGVVQIEGAASPSSGGALISVGQCQPCHQGGLGGGSATHQWEAVTSDGGASWHVAPTSLNLTMFAFSGRDGWAEGTGSDRIARFFVSHDGGRAWHVASSDAVNAGGVGGVSTAAGEVWSLGCTGANSCTDTILRAPASSDHLAKTAGQPPLGDTTNVSVVATARDDAYVLTDDYGTIGETETITRTRLFATHDGGRTWRRLSAACPTRTFGRLYAGGTDALWALCSPIHGPSEIRRSTDGGANWTTLASRPNDVELYPESAQVAWATTPAGKVFRSDDGGRTWTSVWSGGRPEPTAPSNLPPGLNRSWSMFLTVQSPTTATVIVQVGSGRAKGHAARTDLVTYRTSDGGRTWSPGVVRLPAG